MKTPTIEKIAAVDAHNWARAEMFFGKGAGTQRKLLWAEINKKLSTIPEYKDAFDKAYQSQDFADHAIKAAQQRQKIDRAAKAGQNFRALKRGNVAGLSNGIFIAVGVVYVAHATGYDKKIEAEARAQWSKAKTEYKIWKLKRQGKNVERII